MKSIVNIKHNTHKRLRSPPTITAVDLLMIGLIVGESSSRSLYIDNRIVGDDFFL